MRNASIMTDESGLHRQIPHQPRQLRETAPGVQKPGLRNDL